MMATLKLLESICQGPDTKSLTDGISGCMDGRRMMDGHTCGPVHGGALRRAASFIAAVVVAVSAAISIAPHSSLASSLVSSIANVGQVTPTVAFNTLGASHTVTFTCNDAAGAGTLTTGAGCYDVTTSVTNNSLSGQIPVISATCAGSQVSFTSFVPMCGSLAPGDTATATIQSGVPFAYLFTLSGYVPALCPSGGCSSPSDTGGSCPAGTGPSPVVLGNAAMCTFTVNALKYYLEVEHISLSGTSCGGPLIYSNGRFFGTPCSITASATGGVVVKAVAACPANPGQPDPTVFGSGATYVCYPSGGSNYLEVTNIAIPNVSIILEGSNVDPSNSTGVLTSGGTCSGSVSGIENTWTDTAVSFCPVVPGTASVQAVLVPQTNTQPPVASSPFTFFYSCSTSSCVGPYVDSITSLIGGAGFGPGTPTGRSLVQQLNAVQSDIVSGNTTQALLDLQTFACHVQAQSGKAIPVDLANQLMRDSRILYAGISGGQPLPAC
jgi:hypothetical protein